ncbi:MAG: diguanylate cyclase [Elusimicrobiota bacterium]|nr:diguanylate cyclase [Elusimicrobiota bacterium]
MNPYAIPNLVCALFCLGVGIFVFFKNKKSSVNISFALLCLSTFIWQLGTFMVLLSKNSDVAIFWCRFTYKGAIFIPITTYHFVINFLRKNVQRKFVIISYFIGAILFVPISETKYFIPDLYEYFWGYWWKAGSFHPYFLLFFGVLMIVSFYNFYESYRRETLRIEKIRKGFLFIAILIGYMGVIDFFPNYGIKIYPFGYLPVIICLSIISYTIIRHRLMDISVAIDKTLLFALLFCFILFLQTGLVRTFQSIIGYTPSIIITVGLIVFVLFFTPFRRKLGGFVDVLVYRGKYDYQKVLKDSTKALVTMLDLRQLLNYIVNTISDTVGVEKISLFLKEGNKRKYEIKASCGLDEELVDKYVLKPDEGIIPWLKQSKAVFVKEEMERALPGKAFESIHGDLGKIGAEFILPLFYKDNLVGVLNLSHKQSGGIYNQTDIDILESLGAEAAVAIENARLHTEVITDELTGLYQPRYFELRLREEIEMAKRYSHCLSLMMVEIYNLEEMKKKYGEEEKDNLLKNIASIVSGNLRMGDIACRCGEDGFGIILPEITEEPGVNIRERLKRQIKETVEIGERLRRRVDEEQLGVTVSIGIASFDGQDREMKRETLIKQAKEALSQAQRGGNTVKVFYDEKLRKEISSEVLEWIKETEETLVSGETCVDLTKHTVQVKGKPVKLTPKAFDLLCLLMKKKGRVLNRSFLTESIWGYEYFGTTRTVDSHIKILRQKLGSEGRKIKTIEGIGYKFTEESE